MDVKIQLLVVEDEDNIRNSLVNYIRRNAPYIHTIHEAGDGQTAIDLIMKYRPQIMLLDIRLPVKLGLQVMQETYAAGVMPKTILMSGYSEFEYARQAIRYGVIDYMVKPFRSSDMLDTIEDILRGEKLLHDQEISVESVDALKTATDGSPQKRRKIADQIDAYLNEHFAEEITLARLASEFNITPCYLSTLFSQAFGCRLIEKLNKIRIYHACEYLHDPRVLIYEIAYKVGYNDEKYFGSVFRKVMGISPSEYRESCL